MKVAISKDIGGFKLSSLALSELATRKGYQPNFYRFVKGKYHKVSLPDKFHWVCLKRDCGNEFNFLDIDNLFNEEDIFRDDIDLIEILEKLGEQAYEKYSKIEVVEIPDGSHFNLHVINGVETLNYWS